MFLQSPAAFIDTTVPGFVDDIYANRIDDDSDKLPPRWLVNKLQRERDQNIHFLTNFRWCPNWLLKKFLKTETRNKHKASMYTEEQIEAIANY